MNERMKKGTATALLSVLLTGPLPMGAFAQQSSGTGGTPDASKGNTMTGGAEAQPTDKGTPASGQDNAGAAGASGTGGTSDAGKGNTMTGGAEAQPTDKGTPGTPGPGAGGAASPDSGAGTASGSGQGKP